jgi:hypothetical protein
MLTTEGMNHVRRYMAGYVPAIAGAMVFGTGSRAEQGADFGLQFEVARSQIKLVTYDFAANQGIYKAAVPLDYAGIISEIGLYSSYANNSAGSSGSKMLSDINTGETWVQSGTTTVSTFTATAARIGSEGLSQTPAASTSRADALSGLHLDLSGYSNSDFISLAFNIGNANTSAMNVRFKTDNSNYYTFAIPSVTAGYKFVDFLRSTSTPTGSPSWANITEIELNTTSGAGGASAITWDGIMIQDTDTSNLDYLLVARKVLASPVTKIANQTQDIQYALNVTVS